MRPPDLRSSSRREPHFQSANLALAAVTAFFLLFPLTLGKPGLPTHLKADEGAYYLAAQSLAFDRDLRVEPKDVDRAFQEFPFGPVNNMIVMTDDGWHTVYFAKPYIYSLLGAPFARLFGANGMLFFNMLMTMAMVWMGYLYLPAIQPARARGPLLGVVLPAQRRLLLRLLDPARGLQHVLGGGLPLLRPAAAPTRPACRTAAASCSRLALGRRAGARRLQQADVRRRGARAALGLRAGTAAGRRSASGCSGAMLSMGAIAGVAVG